MSATLARIFFAASLSFVASSSQVKAEGGQLIEEATRTEFDEITQEGGKRFKCLGVGVRKLMVANVYSVAFCMDAAHADPFMDSYVEKHHAGLHGDSLSQALRKDQKFFEMLATSNHDRLAVLKMERNLSRKQLATNIRRSLSALLPAEKLDQLTASITAGAEKDQVVKILAIGPKLTVDVAGAARTFEDEEVARKLFLVWLGPRSVSPTLREHIARQAARLR